MAGRNEEFDWIFDFALQFLESDKFDAAVMDFVDEKCYLFEDDDENKLIYSDIHQEFCDHIEALISSNLGELGISNELFLESCEKARDGRDINATVFERLTAMDDFLTFKKIMIKRNTELQLESIRSFQVNTPTPKISSSKKNNIFSPSTKRDCKDDFDELDQLLTPEELMALKEADEMDFENFEAMDEDEMQDLLLQSLMEMELIHRQEELEHAEIERALTLSLAVEEERLRLLMAEAKLSSSNSNHTATAEESVDENMRAEAKASSQRRESGDGKDITNNNNAASTTTSAAVRRDSKAVDTNHTSSTSEPKGLRPLPSLNRALPAIGASSGLSSGLGVLGKQPLAALGEKKKQTEEALRRNYEQLSEQRKQEDALRKQVNAGIDPAEAERRARHMQQQRDLLIAKKKAERDQKVRIEEERKNKRLNADPEQHAELVDAVQRLNGTSDVDDKSAPSMDEIAEVRRSTMRTALARRMKMDLLETEEAKISQMQEDQFSELDKRLKQVEQLREDNKKREFILNRQMERQQAQIARNIRISAEELSRNGGN